jgi:hypothetical protein
LWFPGAPRSIHIMMKLLVLLATLGYGVIALARLRQRWLNRIESILPPPADYSVVVEAPGGGAGWIAYREQGESCRFAWELPAGRGASLRIAVPPAEQWDREVPWARGRRQQILARVAEEVIRKHCKRCRWEIDEDAIHFHPA